MAEQSRSFRKFMMDPKSSVMTYIADNIPPDRIAHQQGSAQTNSLHGQSTQDPSGFQQNIGQNQSNQAIAALSQTSSPQPTYGRPVQSPPLPAGQPYFASNLDKPNQPTSSGPFSSNTQTAPRPETPQWRIQESQLAQPQAQNLSGQSHVMKMGALGEVPPPGERIAKSSPQSAPRQYHRMVLDFSSKKSCFFLAQSREYVPSFVTCAKPDLNLEHNLHTMASIAYELEAQAHRIWSLRVERSWEFEGFSESGHQSVITGWQAQYEMWADTVLDIQEGHSSPSEAKPSMSISDLMSGGAQGWDSYGAQDNSGHQDLQNNNMQSHGSMQAQEMAQLQNLSVNQNMPPQESMADLKLEQPAPAGAFPQSNLPAYNGTSLNQSMPPQQRHQWQQQQQQHQQQQQDPSLHQIPVGQNGIPFTGTSLQSGQSMQPGPVPNQQDQRIPQGPGPYPQQAQNPSSGAILPGSMPNVQQAQSMLPMSGPFGQQGQNMAPGGRGQVQQGQSMAPAGGLNMQQRPNIAQGPPQTMQQPQNVVQGPSGPPRNPTPSGPNTQPYSSPRPGPQMPPSLQLGGPMQGSARQ